MDEATPRNSENVLPNSPEMVEFLAATLSVFMDVDRFKGREWTKIRVARDIQNHPDTEGTMSDTTLGRFLDINYPQAPSSDTAAKVAAFLLRMDCITERELELVAADLKVRNLSILNQLFWLKPGRSRDGFYRQLRGTYSSARLEGSHLLLSNLILTVVETADNALRARETFRIYKIGDPDRFRALTETISPKEAYKIERSARASGGRFIRNDAFAGVAAANSGLGLALFQNKKGEPLSLASLDAVSFTDNDQIEAIEITRNSGWVAGEGASPNINENASLLETLRKLSPKYKYNRTESIVIRNIEFDYSNKEWLEYMMVSEEDKNLCNPEVTLQKHLEEMRVHYEGLTPDEKLSKAYKIGDHPSFLEALKEGANPNINEPPPPNADRFPGLAEEPRDPIIFAMAYFGQTHLVEAMIATGRLDLTVRDSDGMRPSHRPGVMEREMPYEPDGFTDDVGNYGKIRDLLLAEEIRQLNAKRDQDTTPNQEP